MIEQRDTLAAAMDRILPSERGAGATAAHAIEYADWLSSQAAFERIEHQLIDALGLLDRLAVASTTRRFVDCDAEEMDAVLRLMAEMPVRSVRDAFWVLVRLTLAGFLCDPRYGGNHRGVGWRNIGFPGAGGE